MDQHFRAFSFVDRITSVEAGVRIRGAYWIPPGLDEFPSTLVCESVGQLAAWAAMAAVNFERRPVAGIAGGIELLSAVRPGQMLELAAELESVDTGAVCYGGTASVEGHPVVHLQHCVGPMVSLAEFDDPNLIRNRFALLCGPGATPGGFDGVPVLPLEHTNGERGQTMRAILQVPASAPFFADHFPRRAVFPGTLLMNANLRLAAELANEISLPDVACQWTLRTVSDVKLRSFIPPGEALELEARVIERAGNTAVLAVETRKGKRIVVSARVLLMAKERT